jgi:cytidine deaminase
MLNQQDSALLEQARSVLKERFKQDWHHVGAALRTRSGKTFAAVHLEAYVGRIAVCAEAIAIGMAAAEGATEIETIVAVNRRGEVVDPCVMCRELISDYSPEALVILPSDEGEIVLAISTLLPSKYRR